MLAYLSELTPLLISPLSIIIIFNSSYFFWDDRFFSGSNAYKFKGTVSRDFLLLVFYESISPQPQSIPLGPFRIVSKIRGDIRKSRCTTGVNDTGGKFATGVNDTGGKLPLVSTTPAANLPPRECHFRAQKSLDFQGPPLPMVHLEPRISQRIFEKIRNGRNGILKCLGETDSWKKSEVENLVTLSL